MRRSRASRILLTLAILGWVSAVALARWAHVDAKELVSDSDLIVVGTLTRLHHWTEDEVDHAIGRIEVNEVLVGTSPQRDFVKLKWDNPSNLLCPRVSHDDVEGRLALWFLKVESDGTVRAEHPARSVPLDDLEAVRYVVGELQGAEGRVERVRGWLEEWSEQPAIAEQTE